MTDELIEDETPRAALSPAGLARDRETSGRPVTSDGEVWMLSPMGLARILAPYRNSIYDDAALYDDVALSDIRACAWYMLSANYRINTEQAIRIIDGCDQRELIDAISDEMMVHRWDQDQQNYSNWARSALISNGIDPANVERQDLPHVLRQLTETGRAIKLHEFTIVDEHATMKRTLLGKV